MRVMYMAVRNATPKATQPEMTPRFTPYASAWCPANAEPITASFDQLVSGVQAAFARAVRKAAG